MKRLFKKWLKTKNPKIEKMSFGQITIAFNKWISGYAYKSTKERRFPFNAYTNKFMVRKWREQINIKY